MHNNRNTENESEHLPLDTQDWEIAFEVYEGNPGGALMLGFNLMVLLSHLAVKPVKIQEAIEGVERAIEVLFPYTQLHEVSRNLFLRLIGGKLTMEEEEALKALGIRF
jgi:hypothetical protein